MFDFNSIITGDSLLLIKAIPDTSVDLIIADIPYFAIVDADWDNQWVDLDAYIGWLDVLFGQFERIMKDHTACYVYCAISHYPHVQICLNNHLTYSSTITWKKQRSRGNGWGFNREEICVNVKGEHVFKEVETETLMLPHLRKGSFDYSNGGKRVRTRSHKLASSIWDDIAQTCSYRKQIHPTEKPVENARRIIEASSKRDDLVFIPFVGSGSECEACIRLGRNYIGFEASQNYCDIAEDRLKNLRPEKNDLVVG